MCGDCLIKDFQLITILLDVEFFIKGHHYDRVARERRNQSIMCSQCVTILGTSVGLFCCGKGYLVCFPAILVCMLPSLLELKFLGRILVHVFR
jgi:hypothetical protein